MWNWSAICYRYRQKHFWSHMPQYFPITSSKQTQKNERGVRMFIVWSSNLRLWWSKHNVLMSSVLWRYFQNDQWLALCYLYSLQLQEDADIHYWEFKMKGQQRQIQQWGCGNDMCISTVHMVTCGRLLFPGPHLYLWILSPRCIYESHEEFSKVTWTFIMLCL